MSQAKPSKKRLTLVPRARGGGGGRLGDCLIIQVFSGFG
jgi:hypothetical protein